MEWEKETGISQGCPKSLLEFEWERGKNAS